jgi:ABC-type uncharacterized transport system substrate-binding protein
MRGRVAAGVLVQFVVLLALAILLAPAEAQQTAKVYRVGTLGPGSASQAEPFLAVFRQRMRELGWVEGTHFVLERRRAEGRMEQFPDLASDLVRSKVDVIVAWSTPAVQAAKRPRPPISRLRDRCASSLSSTSRPRRLLA